MSDYAEKAKPPKRSKASKTPVDMRPVLRPEPPTLLKVGQTVASESGKQYLVMRMLGKGGFGEVYRVAQIRHPERQFAMKVEKIDKKMRKKGALRLKVEIHVFDTIAAAEAGIDTSHFVRLHDRGITKTFKYYVMDLVSQSLLQIFEKVCNYRFSPSTLIATARQTLAGIQALHELGFLHRDIKPANFAVGLPPKDNIIYTLDFGIARPFKGNDGNILLPREEVPFMGTLIYASRRGLEWKEQCRKDDLEVWLYMMLEFYDQNNIWWRRFKPNQVNEIHDAKVKLMEKAAILLDVGTLKMPRGYCRIINYIRKMDYFDSGDFVLLNGFLSKIVADEMIDECLPLDWVTKRQSIVEEEKEAPDTPVVPVEEEKKPNEGEDGKAKEVVAAENSEDPVSGEDEEERKRRRKKKGRKKGSREGRSRDVDRSRDTSEDRDNDRKRGGLRRRTSKEGGGRKIRSKQSRPEAKWRKKSSNDGGEKKKNNDNEKPTSVVTPVEQVAKKPDEADKPTAK